MQVANIRRGIACVAVPKGNLMTLDWDNTNCVNCELLKWHLSGCRTNNTLQNYIPPHHQSVCPQLLCGS